MYSYYDDVSRQRKDIYVPTQWVRRILYLAQNSLLQCDVGKLDNNSVGSGKAREPSEWIPRLAWSRPAKSAIHRIFPIIIHQRNKYMYTFSISHALLYDVLVKEVRIEVNLSVPPWIVIWDCVSTKCLVEKFVKKLYTSAIWHIQKYAVSYQRFSLWYVFQWPGPTEMNSYCR